MTIVDSRSATGHTGPRPRAGWHGGPGNPGGSNHAERVFRVQQAFAELGGGIRGLAELTKASGVDDSAVHRILRSGVAHGTFVRVGRGRYRLGPEAAKLGIEALEQGADRAALGLILNRLRAKSGDGLAFLYGLSRLGGVQRQCVEMAVGASDLTEVGLSPRELLASHQSLRVGSSGRTILAHLPESVQRRVADEAVPAGMGPGAFRDRARLLGSLAEIRTRGYAIGLEECARGWNSFAAPVLWGDVVVGAVTVMVPVSLSAAPGVHVDAVRCAAAAVQRLILDH